MNEHNNGGQAYNIQEQELIRQLVRSRMEQKLELEYEDLEGYELPPRTQFSMLKKPAVSIKYKEFTFNMSCIRLFEGVKHVLTIVNPNKKRLAVIPCKEEESSSVEWARVKSDGQWINKTITSLEFVEKLYSLMGWNRNCRYKVMGRIANSPRGVILIFDFTEAIMFSEKPIEFINKETGEIRRHIVTYYPDEYKGCIGKSYNDYVQGQQLNLFEQFEGYTGQTYSDAQKQIQGQSPGNGYPPLRNGSGGYNNNG